MLHAGVVQRARAVPVEPLQDLDDELPELRAPITVRAFAVEVQDAVHERVTYLGVVEIGQHRARHRIDPERGVRVPDPLEGAPDDIRQRLQSMGLRTGREAEVIRCSRQGPMQIRVGSIDLIMRRSDAARVSITTGQ